MLGKLFDVLPSIFDGINKVFPNEVDRKKAETQVMEIALRKFEKSADLEMAKMEADTELARQQAKVIVSEANSGDKYTSRARPTAMYVFLAIIVWYTISVTFGWPVPPPEVQAKAWDAIGLILTGYIGVRGAEKIFKMHQQGKKHEASKETKT